MTTKRQSNTKRRGYLPRLSVFTLSLLSLFTIHYSLLSANADMFSTNGFSKRAQIRTSGYTTNVTLTNFPYLVVFTNGALNFTYANFQGEGRDLRFCDNSLTNTLFHEIEKWNSNGSSYVWVRLPYLNSTTNSFWAFWGNSTGAIPVTSTNGSTWATNFLGVWHMDLSTNVNGGKTNFINDASTNNNHGIATNATLSPNGLRIPTNVLGIAGNAIGFDPSQTNYINCGTNVLTASGGWLLQGDKAFTVSAWINRRQTNALIEDMLFSFSSTNVGYDYIETGIEYGSDQDQIFIAHNPTLGFIYDSRLSVSSWTYVAFTYNPAIDTTKFFVNGDFVGFVNWPNLNFGGAAARLHFGAPAAHYGLPLGNYIPSSTCGTQSLDEIRFSSEARSPTWIWAEYQNIKSNSSFGYLDVYGAPVINNANGASNVSQTAATLMGNLLSTGSYLTAVTVYYGTTDGGTNAGSWANSYSYPAYPTVGLVTQQLTVNPNSTYYYRHYATNLNGTRWAPSTASFTTLPSTNSSTHSVRINLRTSVAGTQTNFPASIILNTSMTGFSYSDFSSASGYDLRFSTTNLSQEFSYEIEKWNTEGDSYVWVLIPNMTSNTTILAHWGNPAFATAPPAYTTNGAVWPNYRAVWHMNSTDLLDSSVYRRNATNYGGTISTGNIGNAMVFDTSKYATWGGSSWTSSAMTVEALVNLETIVSLQRIITMNGYTVSIRNLKEPEGPNGSIEFTMGNKSVISDKALSRRRWHYVAGTVEPNGIMRVYVDGTQVGIASGAVPPTISGGFISDISQDVTRGGMLDEVRISDTALPLGRIRTTYANALSNTTFTTVEDIAREIMFEPFEYNSNGNVSVATGNLNGQHGWIVSPFNGAIVQSSDIHAGTNAVTIGTNDVIVYRGFSDPTATNVWVDFVVKAPRRTDPGAPGLSASAAAGFYINTNFNIVAKSGTNWVTLTGAVATAYGGTTTNFTAASNGWSRFQVYLSYVPGKWWLLATPSVTGQQAYILATNLSFNSQRTSLTRFQVTATNALYAGQMDTVYIWKEDNPTNFSIPNLDLNTNNIPDAWERSYVIGGTDAVVTNDADGDGYDEMAEFIMGTDPHDASSFTKITGLELVSNTGNNVRVTITGGDRNTTDGRNSSGDTRTYRIVASSTYTNLNSSLLGTQTENLSGENEYIDVAAAITASNRFYQVQVSMNGRSYTNTERWAMFTQQRPAGQRQLMTVPVSIGGAATEQSLAGTLGQQLGWGLHAGNSTGTSDYVAFLSAGGSTWKNYYWMSQDGGTNCYWYDPSTGTNVTTDLLLQPGTGFWLYRSSGAPTRTNAVLLGQLYSESDIPASTVTTGRWTIIGMALPDTLRQRNQGTNTSTNAMGFVNAVGGNNGNLSSPNSGSQLYIWNGSGWKSYWLYDNHTTNASTINRRWWDPSSNTYANISLEPGMAFYLWNSTNWSSSSVRPPVNYNYTPQMTNY